MLPTFPVNQSETDFRGSMMAGSTSDYITKEREKLTATFLSNCGVACFGTGGIGFIVSRTDIGCAEAIIYGMFFVVGVSLHLAGRRVFTTP
jgi:hypothetical protein